MSLAGDERCRSMPPNGLSAASGTGGSGGSRIRSADGAAISASPPGGGRGALISCSGRCQDHRPVGKGWPESTRALLPEDSNTAQRGRRATDADRQILPAARSTARGSHDGRVGSGQRPFRSKIDWAELRLLIAYIAFFGTLLVAPLWSQIVLRESNGGWAGVVAVIVGLAAFVGLWRYLRRPVRPEDEGDDLLHRRGWQRPESRYNIGLD